MDLDLYLYFHRTSWPAALLMWSKNIFLVKIKRAGLKRQNVECTGLKRQHVETVKTFSISFPSYSAGSCLALLEAVLEGEVKSKERPQ